MKIRKLINNDIQSGAVWVTPEAIRTIDTSSAGASLLSRILFTKLVGAHGFTESRYSRDGSIHRQRP